MKTSATMLNSCSASGFDTVNQLALGQKEYKYISIQTPEKIMSTAASVGSKLTGENQQMGWGEDKRRRGLAPGQWTSPVSTALHRSHNFLLLSLSPLPAANTRLFSSTFPSVGGSGFSAAPEKLYIWWAGKTLSHTTTTVKWRRLMDMK